MFYSIEWYFCSFQMIQKIFQLKLYFMNFLSITVSYTYSSRWNWYTTIFLLSVIDMVIVEMATKRIYSFSIISNYIDNNEILCNLYYAIIKLCTFWNFVSNFQYKFSKGITMCIILNQCFRVRQLFDTANYMYILPAHRLTVYIIGILLGYILRNFKKISFKSVIKWKFLICIYFLNWFLFQVHIQIGDTLAILMFSLAFFGPAFMGSINYKYDPTDAAWYAAFAPIAWCFSFAWVIYKSHFGHEGK